MIRTYPLFFENKLARDVGRLLTSRGKENFAHYKDALNEFISVSDIGELTDSLPIKDLITADDKKLLNKSITNAMLYGGNDKEVTSFVVDFLYRKTYADSQFDAVSHYGNTFFNNVVHRSLVREINRQEGVTERDRKLRGTMEGLQKLKDIVDRNEIDSPSTRLMANQIISRSYAYGTLKDAQLKGQTGYQLVATIDDRTSDICLELNGKTFFVFAGLRMLEDIASSDPEEAAIKHPWVDSVETIQGLDGGGLTDAGFLLPPFHPSCRTIVAPF